MEVSDDPKSRTAAEFQLPVRPKHGPRWSPQSDSRPRRSPAVQRKPACIVHSVLPANPAAGPVLPLADGAWRRARMRLVYGHAVGECRRRAANMPIGRANGITPYPQLSTWPENYTALSIEPSALTVYARPSSIRIVRVGLFDGKKESGATLTWSLVRSCPQLSAASHSSHRATGLCRAKSAKAENGDDPRASRPA